MTAMLCRSYASLITKPRAEAMASLEWSAATMNPRPVSGGSVHVAQKFSVVGRTTVCLQKQLNLGVFSSSTIFPVGFIWPFSEIA